MIQILLDSYETTILSWGALAALLLLQLLVADIVGIKSRHVPGSAVEANHDSLLFRASRTVANTNESIAVYLIVVLFCIFSGANPVYTGYLSWAYVVGRAAYACCYYFNQQILRSVCFAITLLVLISLLLTGFIT